MVLRSSLPFASDDEFIKDDIYNEGKKGYQDPLPMKPLRWVSNKVKEKLFWICWNRDLDETKRRNFFWHFRGSSESHVEAFKAFRIQLIEFRFFLIKKLLYLSLAQMTDKTYENPHERKPFFIRSSTLVVDVKRAELFVCWKFYERETCVWIVVGRFLLCSNNEKHFLVCDSYNHDYKW